MLNIYTIFDYKGEQTNVMDKGVGEVWKVY